MRGESIFHLLSSFLGNLEPDVTLVGLLKSLLDCVLEHNTSHQTSSIIDRHVSDSHDARDEEFALKMLVKIRMGLTASCCFNSTRLASPSALAC
jgi:hypothetical protein